MRVWPVTVLLSIVFVAVTPLRSDAQTTLTLAEAMARARSASPEARAHSASVAEAEARVTEARSGYYPRLDASESIQRGDQPVFVFSSLLSQRRFTAANFAVAELNHPAPITNTRTALAIEQPIFDAGQTRLAVKAASLSRDLTTVERDRAGQDLAARAAEVFVRVLRLEAAVRATAAALAAADSDLQRARDRRAVGVVTDSDVLAVEVHAADVRQWRLAEEGDLVVARLELAEVVGLPLSERIALVTPQAAPTEDHDGLVSEALQTRWERKRVDLEVQLAETARQSARAKYLPTLGVQGGVELNGRTLSEQQSSWIVGAQVQLNLFRGFADRARVVEAEHAKGRAAAEHERVTRRIEVEVRTALAQLNAARARQDAGRIALAQARESQRIIRDRYETGLASVTDVLRAAEAALAADSQATAAAMDVIVRRVALDRALGRL